MNRKGFTLIELLIVIAIIGILAAAVLVAVDPVGRIQDARNARRWSEANGLLNAVLNKQVDDRAMFMGSGANVATLAGLATDVQIIVDSAGTSITPAGDCGSFTYPAVKYIDMDALSPTYIAAIPLDPAGNNSATNTGYYYRLTTGGRITIGSCNPEPGVTGTAPDIKVTR